MIKVHPLTPKPLKYVNCIVLSAKFMHGDADATTYEEMVADLGRQDQLALVKAVYDAYESFGTWFGPYKNIPDYVTITTPERVYSDPPNLDDGYDETMELYEDMGIGSMLVRMFPWDSLQAEIGMYENRAKLEKYELTYYDSAGHPFHVVLTNSE